MTEQATPEPNGRVTPRDLYTAVERVRLESKADLRDAEGRLTTAIENVGTRFERYTEAHQSKHDEAAAALRAVAALLETHLHDEQVDGAVTRDRIGLAKAAWGWVDRHLAIVVAAILGLLAFTANLSIQIGVK